MKLLLTVVLGITALISNGASSARADHVCRRFHLAAFEDANRHLGHELEERRESLQRAFEAQRDAVLAEIRRVEQCFRGREREDAVRVLHRELERVNREHHRNLRGLHEEFDDRRRELTYVREDALRDCRTTQCSQACFVEPQAPPPGVEVIPPPQSVPSDPHPPSPNTGAKANQPAQREALDWPRLVLDLLARHIDP
jgi:hypothetical protein